MTEEEKNINADLTERKEVEGTPDPAESGSGGAEPAEKEPAEKEPAEKEPAEKEPAEKEPAEKEPAEKEPAEKEPAEKEPAEKEPAEKEPERKPDAFFGAKGRERSGSEEIIERVVRIGRVSKVVKGGKNFSFNAIVVAGNGQGSVGIGFGKSNEVVGAITKGTADAKKNLRKIRLKENTIPHEVTGEFKAARVLLKPAGPGTGVIAGGTVRALCDAVGIKNILTKSLGSRNPVNVVKATMVGFLKLRSKRRG